MSMLRGLRSVAARRFSTSAAPPPPPPVPEAAQAAATASSKVLTAYPGGMQAMHWIHGGAMVGCVAFAQAAQRGPKESKGRMMFLHKSCGLTAAMLLVPRVAVRVLSARASKIPAELPGPKWQELAGRLNHYGLYLLSFTLPGSGIAMGYYGGKGLPFWFTTLDGAEKANGAIAKKAFQAHGYMGKALEYFLVPAHVAAVPFTYFSKGKNILTRILPFGK